MNTPTDNRIKIWPLIGGIHFESDNKGSASVPLRTAVMPSKLVLPLSQHAGSAAEPIVSEGDCVLKGEVIAKASGPVSAAVHAPTSGRIAAVAAAPVPHPSGMSALCITLIPDGEDRWCALFPTPDFRERTTTELLDKIAAAGITGLGGAGFPTATKLAAGRENVNTLILNGVECEPCITADDRLMRERADQIVQGVEIICHLLGNPVCLIGIEDNKPEAIDAMRAAIEQRGVDQLMELAVIPTRYPSGGEKQLVQILTGQEIPSGRHPTDIGIVVQNVGTAFAVYEAVVLGKPLISRITTLTGTALSAPGNFEVLFGTLVSDLLPQASVDQERLSTLVHGGPMMGHTLHSLDLPVVKSSNCLIAATSEEFPPVPPEQACIRCGHCAEVCPASLLPQQLYWHARSENHQKLRQHNLFDCIECGACAWVCPSHIPLVQYYRASKSEIRQSDAKKAKSERSKVRYENRQARLAREQEERAARRKLARERSQQQSPVSNGDTAADAKKRTIQLAIVRSELKKALQLLERAQSTGESDTRQLKENIEQLQQQLTRMEAAAKTV